MELFEFLDILSVEGYTFTMEYLPIDNAIKVSVDTFTKKEDYVFNKDGIIEYMEYVEADESDDSDEIIGKINDLVDRAKRAWTAASEDLGINFIAPYRFTGANGEIFETAGLLPEFGSGKGVLIIDQKTDDEAIAVAEQSGEYFLSALSPRYYYNYNRELFIETLTEWGWIGEGEAPEWYKK